MVSILAVIAAPFWFALAALDLWAGPSTYGLMLIVTVSVVWAAALTAARRKRRFVLRGTSLGALLLLTGRTVATEHTGVDYVIYTRDSLTPKHVPVLAALIPEHDLAVSAAFAIGFLRKDRDPDLPGLPAAMDARYRELERDYGETASMIAPVYAGYTHSHDHEMGNTLVLHAEYTDKVVIFLHGFAGPFTLPCYQVSRAAAEAEFSTLCPEDGFDDTWHSHTAEVRLNSLLDQLQEAGARAIVLVGLSNGAVGASLVAPSLRSALSGVILLAGVAPGAAAPAGVPALVVCGTRDSECPAGTGRAYAGGHGTFLGPVGGHFVLATQPNVVEPAIAKFLRSIKMRATYPQNPTRRSPSAAR